MILQRKEEFLYPFWDTVLGAPVGDPEPAATLKPQSIGTIDEHESSQMDESTRPRKAMSAQKKGPGYGILAGYWVKVNLMLLEHHPKELMDAIKGIPNFVERIVAHFEWPTLTDFVFRLIQTDETHPESSMVEWFAEKDLISHTVGLLSPYVSQELNTAASEFLKSVISLSAPSPSSLSQYSDGIGGGTFGVANIGISNLLVRELAAEENVRKMVAFMLDYKEAPVRDESSRTSARQQVDFGLETLPEISSSDESAVEDDEDDALTLQMNLRKRSMSVAQTAVGHRDSMATVRPESGNRRMSMARPVLSQQAQNTAFICCTGVFIELIRKNNSDYFEQHLFHTLRNYLQLRKHEISGSAKGLAMQDRYEMTLDDLQFDDNADIDAMEQALAEVSEKLGIVHLVSVLQILAERIPDLQAIMSAPLPGTSFVSTTVGLIEPLTQIKYCISELYAELLHCSNMALMNREPGTGPQYSPLGSLQGGIKGIEVLASALQGEDAVMSVPEDYSQSEQKWSEPQPVTSVPEVRTECEDDENEAEHIIESNPDTDPVQETRNSPDEEKEHPARERQDSLGVSSTPEDDDDAKSIASALSSLSLADLIQQFASGPPSLSSDQEEPRVLGDYLKRQFLEHGVIPMLLNMFIKYPWNNFLHNVVYDIVQQLFNGEMQKSANRELTVSVFEQGRLFDKLLEGTRLNSESSKGPRRVRLGYMGHLNLVAEETVKLLERYPRLIEPRVRQLIPQPEWDEYLANELNVCRAKESVQLAGGRPNISAADMIDSDTEDYADGDVGGSFARYLSEQLRSGVAVDDDDYDAQQAVQDSAINDDDWGPFADQDNSGTFEFSSTSAATEPESAISTRSENLTPADWAADFRRTSMAGIPASAIQDDDSDSEDASPQPTRHRRRSSTSSSSSSEGGSGDDLPYVDLHHPALLRSKAQDLNARRPGVPDESQADSQHWPVAAAAKKRRASSSCGDRAAVLAKNAFPFKVEETEDGLLKRTLEDGTTVVVPLDDAELFESETDNQEDSSST